MQKLIKIRITLITFLAALLVACCTTQKPVDPQDPYEHYNRQMFTFNQQLDTHFFKPVAKAYRYMLYPQVRTGITNFYSNFSMPGVIADDILEGDLMNAMGDSWRFVINSTLGILGVFDIASNMKEPIPYHENDFGLVMARWGITKSEYFVLPILGPSTTRDTFGMFVNYYAFSFFPYIHPYYVRYGILWLDFINIRANLLDYQNILEVAALDPYVFQRNAYLQRRQYLISQMQETLKSEYSDLNTQSTGYFLKPTHPWKNKNSAT